jgi:glycosyltransferase involved in cell wall biosynthesis
MVNIFVIPSWYPSISNPIYGTFVKEQILLMAKQSAELNFGVSLWGQGDDPFLLYAGRSFDSLRKRLVHHEPYQSKELANHRTYFTPAFSWTRRWRKGNLHGLIKSNEENLKHFEKAFGKPDLIHVQASWPGAWIANELSKRFDVPYVVTLRMSPFPFSQFLSKKGQLRSELFEVLNEAEMLIATSNSLADQVREFGLSNVVVVHNPVDTELFKPCEQQPSHNTDKYKMLAVGRLEDQKGFDILITALAMLPEHFHLDIVGEGSERTKLEKLISDYQLMRRVKLVGEQSREEVAKHMRKCDIYVLSSRHETFGNVLLEAMACGKPVVATRCGGPSDIVTPDVGILCESESANSLSQAIMKAYEINFDSHRIRDHVISHFSPNIFTSEMKSVYERVVKSSR